jgi:hypothetical protein
LTSNLIRAILLVAKENIMRHEDDTDQVSTLTEVVAQEVALVSDPDPAQCRCHGGGYILSGYDTWEHCSYHWSASKRHPEYDWEDDGQVALQLVEVEALSPAFVPTPPSDDEDILF